MISFTSSPKKFLFAVSVMVVCLFSYNTVLAFDFYQTDYSEYYTDTNGIIQLLGQGDDTPLESIAMRWQLVGTGGAVGSENFLPSVILAEYNDSGYTSFSQSWTVSYNSGVPYVGSSEVDIVHDEALDFSSLSITLSSTKYYYIRLTPGATVTNAENRIYGSGTDDVVGCSTNTATFPSCGGTSPVVDSWYDINNQTPPFSYTGVIDVNYPIENSTTTSPVGWSFNFHNSTDDQIDFFYVSFFNTTLYESFYSSTSTMPAGVSTQIGTTTLPNGSYQMTVWGFYNSGGASSYDNKTVNFSVGATSTVDLVGFDLNDPQGLLAQMGFATTTCGITSGEKILGCVIQAGLALLWPSKDSMDRILSIKDLVVNKPPIGYFTVLKTELEQISTTTTPVVNVIVPQFTKDIFFDPINTALTGILWWFFAVNFYHRLKNLHIV